MKLLLACALVLAAWVPGVRPVEPVERVPDLYPPTVSEVLAEVGVFHRIPPFTAGNY